MHWVEFCFQVQASVQILSENTISEAIYEHCTFQLLKTKLTVYTAFSWHQYFNDSEIMNHYLTSWDFSIG